MDSILLQLLVRVILRFGRGDSCGPGQSAVCDHQGSQRRLLRRFLFHTALASGAPPGLPPFALEDDFDTRPLVDLTTSLGRLLVSVPLDADVEPVAAAALSLGLVGAAGAELLTVRNFWLTLMDLKAAGFLTDDRARAWPLSSPSLVFDASPLAASLSEPPLMLTSVDRTKSSTMSAMCLLSRSSVALLLAAESPFTCSCSAPASLLSVSRLMA